MVVLLRIIYNSSFTFGSALNEVSNKGRCKSNSVNVLAKIRQWFLFSFSSSFKNLVLILCFCSAKDIFNHDHVSSTV